MVEHPAKSPVGLNQAFKAIVNLANQAFKGLPPGYRVAVAFAAFAAIILLALGITLGIAGTLSSKEVVLLFIVSLLFFLLMASLPLLNELRQKPLHPQRTSVCRHVPIYPPAERALGFLQAAMIDIQSQAFKTLATKISDLPIEKIRANLFLLAKIDDGSHKLVIHRKLTINMNHPPEWNIQFSLGQGATGQAFSTNVASLTRRLSEKAGQWDRVHQMTPKLKALVHPDLKWIVTIPLIPTGQFQSLGVFNIDGIVPVADDELLLRMGAEIRDHVTDVADYLNVLPSICVDIGVI